MRKSLWTILTVLSVAIGAPTALRANDITYNVNLAVGAGSATGTIVTDGNTGILTTADIASWYLTLTTPTGTVVDTSTAAGAGVEVYLNGLTASATKLLFNFSAPCCTQVYFNGNVTPTIELWIGVGGAGGLANIWVPLGAGDQLGATQGFAGDVVIGTTAPTTVPEPGTISLTLMGIGLLGLMMVVRKRISRALPQAT